MAGAKALETGKDTPKRPMETGRENLALYIGSESEDIQRSGLPPIEVKVTDKPESTRAAYSDYEKGTGRSG